MINYILSVCFIIELCILVSVTILVILNPTTKIKREKGYLYYVDANGYIYKTKCGPKRIILYGLVKPTWKCIYCNSPNHKDNTHCYKCKKRKTEMI